MRKSDVRRRWLGAIFLLLAAAMLIAGELFARNPSRDWRLLIFWLACLVFTMLAVLTALLDVMALRRRAREQQRELLKKTLEEIAEDDRAKSRRPPDSSQSAS